MRRGEKIGANNMDLSIHLLGKLKTIIIVHITYVKNPALNYDPRFCPEHVYANTLKHCCKTKLILASKLNPFGIIGILCEIKWQFLYAVVIAYGNPLVEHTPCCMKFELLATSVFIFNAGAVAAANIIPI